MGILCLTCVISIRETFSGTYPWHKTRPACTYREHTEDTSITMIYSQKLALMK